MQEVTFVIQALTPLFMAGNHQKQVEVPRRYVPLDMKLSEEEKYTWQLQAELRAPAFRGLMRYWHRALVGGLVGTNPEGLLKVIDEEKKVFGSTNQSSAVHIRVSYPSENPREYRREGSKDNPSGRGYLLWSMPKSGQVGTDKLRLDRFYYPPDTIFTIKLSAKDKQISEFPKALASFWVLTNLGGVGSRSRRCAGSLVAKPQQPLSGNISQLSFQIPANVSELKLQLQDGIRFAKSLYSSYPQEPIQEAETEFDILNSNACNIWILQNEYPWSTPEKVMTDLGLSLQNYRRDFSEARARTLLGAGVPRDNRGFNKLKALEVFGLPLGKNNNRRASPLLLRVTKLQREYVCVAVLFKTTVEGISPKNYTIIEDWINTFPMKVGVGL